MGISILIVEDEIRIREGIEKLIGKFGPEYQVIGVASDGREGLTLAEALQPELIITDIRMPYMDGLEMLSAVYGGGMKPEAIVLSAYSEFEYARTALKLGVTEYLLKPIAINDLQQALEHVRERLDARRKLKPAQIGTLEQTLRDLIEGSLAITPDVCDYLESNYKIKENQEFALLCIYLGIGFNNARDRVIGDFKQTLSSYEGLSFNIIESELRQSLIVVLYHYSDARNLERWVQYQMLSRQDGKVSVGWVEANGIRNLKPAFDELYPYMDWNISFDKDILLSYPKITRVRTDSCIYPIELEARMKAEICAYNSEGINAVMKEFHKNLRTGKIYLPKEIKDSYVRFFWVIIDIAREIGCMNEADLDRQHLLGMVMGAKTRDELADAAQFLLGSLNVDRQGAAETTHLTVRKAIAMVREFYQAGITLDEISEKLGITPEYLGTLFHKEMGVSFSTYIRNFRIDKAKELICGTSMKLYEISEKVGYSDPKYFGKVFKETTGMLPTEYRRQFS